jgi:hypothetical protein
MKTRTKGTEHHAHYDPRLHPNVRTRIDGTDGSSYSVRDEVSPRHWDEVGPGDYGPEADFSVDHHGTVAVLFPISRAAILWCSRHLPDDAPRWGTRGYVIEPRYLDPIVQHMDLDGLLSQDEYDMAVAEQQDIARQWS